MGRYISSLFLVLVICVDDLLYFILRAEEHTTLVVNVLRDNAQKALHAGVHSETTGVFKQHSHGRAFVQNTQLTLGGLLVGRVSEDTTVEQCPVSISHHATNVASTVRLLALGGELQRVEVSVGPLLPVAAVTLVDGVDGALGGEGHVGVSEDEFTQGVLQGEAVDAAIAHGDDELGGGTVHGETGGDHLSTGEEEILGGDLVLGTQDGVGQLEDAEDGSYRDASVQVGGSVDGVADDCVAGVGVLVEDDGFFFFFRDEDTAFT